MGTRNYSADNPIALPLHNIPYLLKKLLLYVQLPLKHNHILR